MRSEYGEIVEIDLTHQIFAFVIAAGAVACVVIFIFNKISCFGERHHKEDEDGNRFDGGAGGVCGVICCQSVFDSFCSVKEKDLFETHYAETVKSMDISECGVEAHKLPVEVNSASLATAQFLQAESSMSQLSAGDRARLAENRQVMRAYLISKLVAPRYSVDDQGRILPDNPGKTGHMHREEFHERHSAMFKLVFNGHISVDTRATKRQQREAIRRLKRCSRERRLEKHDKVSISEKETSGVGTDLNSNPPITPTKAVKRTTPKTQTTTMQTSEKKNERMVKRSNSGTSESTAASRRQPIMQRIASAIKLKSPDSAVGSSIGQYDADIESMDRGRRGGENNQNLQPVIEYREESTEYREDEHEEYQEEEFRPNDQTQYIEESHDNENFRESDQHQYIDESHDQEYRKSDDIEYRESTRYHEDSADYQEDTEHSSEDEKHRNSQSSGSSGSENSASQNSSQIQRSVSDRSEPEINDLQPMPSTTSNLPTSDEN